MRTNNRTSVAAAAIIALGVVGAAAVNSVARPAQVAPAPTTLALVDMERLFEGLDEARDRKGAIDAKSIELQAKLNEIADSMTLLNQTFTEIPKTDTRQLSQVRAQMLELETTAKIRRDSYKLIIDGMNADMFREIYAKVNKSAADLAEREGYDVVMLNDSGASAPDQASAGQVMQLISGRRVLYARKSVDVTDRLISAMNNDFAASGGKRQ